MKKSEDFYIRVYFKKEEFNIDKYINACNKAEFSLIQQLLDKNINNFTIIKKELQYQNQISDEINLTFRFDIAY